MLNSCNSLDDIFWLFMQYTYSVNNEWLIGSYLDSAGLEHKI
jgi:hypothetical protein